MSRFFTIRIQEAFGIIFIYVQLNKVQNTIAGCKCDSNFIQNFLKITEIYT